MFQINLANFIGALILIQFSLFASAGEVCPENIIEQLARTDEMQADSTAILSVECKKWPGDETKMLIAYAYTPPNYNESGDDVPFHVGIVRVPQLNILYHYQGKITEDATWKTFGKQYFTFDTARYNLADGVRAFAIREKGFEEPTAATHGADDRFTLLVPADNKRLKPILFIPYMHFWYRQLNEMNERIGYSAASLTISLEKTRTNGFNDLLVTAHERESNKVIFTHLLKFNGNEYPNEELKNKIYRWWQK